MNFKKQFSEPIDKNDLFAVIKQALFMAFVGGLLIGALQLLMAYQFNFSLTWLMLFFLAILTARRIKGAVYQPHILYAFISVFSFFLGYYIMSVTTSAGLYYLITGSLEMNILLQALKPSHYFMFLNPLSATFFSVNNILDIVFFIIGIYYAYNYSK